MIVSDTDRLRMIANYHWGQSRDPDDCSDPECSICAILLCPWAEPLHFHHDGCPACSCESPEPPMIDWRVYYTE